MVGAPYSNQTTSKEAAEAVAPDVGRQQRLVLNYLEKRGEHGSTDFEILRDLDIDPNAVRARRGELVDKGKVADSGKKRLNPDTRKRCIVWVVKEHAPKVVPVGKATVSYNRRSKKVDPYDLRDVLEASTHPLAETLLDALNLPKPPEGSEG